MSLLAPPNDRRFSPRVVQVVALTGVACSSFTITVLSAALATIADDLDSSVSVITWVIAGPLLAFAVFTPMAGKLGDLYGHRRMYLIGFTGAAVFSLLTSAASSAAMLIAVRIVAQGFAASTGPSALAIMMSVFPEDRRTRVAGTWSAVLAAAPAVGVAVGGPLIEATSWRVLFLIQGSGMAIAVCLAWFVLPATDRRDDHTFDIVGSFLLAIGIGSLLVAINRGVPLGWDHPGVLAGLLASPVFVVAFLRYERRIDHPLVEIDALRERNVFLPIVSQVFLNGPYMAGLVITSLLLADVFDLGAAAISLMIIPRPITFSLGASLAGWLVERVGGRPLVVVGTSCIALGLLLIGFGAVQDQLWLIGVGVAIQGGGSGVARPPIIAALTEAIGDRDVGVGTGMLNMTGQLGAAAGISILSALVDDGSSADRFLAVLALAAAIEVVAVVMVAAIRFRGPVQTRTTPASPTSPYSAVVDPDRGRERAVRPERDAADQ
ncbi:MAG: MFS transporter [Actinomycetota bacterium]